MNNELREFDTVISQIADYVCNFQINSELAMETAYYDLLDSLACALMALQFSACTKLLGGVVKEAVLPGGARVPGTRFELDPVQAAFNIGTMIRWLDYNDTFLAAEWGHPSDNFGAVLAVSDYLNRKSKTRFTVNDVLCAEIKAHEIQGIFALKNSFNHVGLDHVVLVKVASTAISAYLLGLSCEQIKNAISLAWVDGQSLRTYRHAPNTGSRKSWAAGDATSRAVRLALIASTGEMGYPTVLSAKTWGFYDVLFRNQSFAFDQPFETYVMENILFKIAFPAEFHAQTAVECALQLHLIVKDRLDEIKSIHVETQESAIRIISKKGVLYNPADRDHCLEYMIAVPLIFGELTADHYEDHIANDPRIDLLRTKMKVVENSQFSKDYLDPNKRSIANAIQITFNDGSKTDLIVVEYPIGHKRRRKEGIPLLLNKFENAITTHYPKKQAKEILSLCFDRQRLLNTPIHQLLDSMLL